MTAWQTDDAVDRSARMLRDGESRYVPAIRPDPLSLGREALSGTGFPRAPMSPRAKSTPSASRLAARMPA